MARRPPLPLTRLASANKRRRPRGNAPLAACAYEDGRGHPLAFARSTFAELEALRGDKGVWKLLDRRAADVVDVPISGRIPSDVDTWEDYRALLAEGSTA